MNPIVPATRMVISHRAMNARVRIVTDGSC